MNTEQNTQNFISAPRLQLAFFRHPVEVYQSPHDEEPMIVNNNAQIFSSS